MSDISTTEQYLHKQIVINSDKQNSAQGSVFYVKLNNNEEREHVLKIYKHKDLKSYYKEMEVFNKLQPQTA